MLHKRARNQTCSPFRERGIKTAARYLLSPLTRAITKQSTHKEQVRARACMKQEPPTLFWGMDQATATMENSVQVLETLKTELPHDLEIPPLDLQAKETIIWKDACSLKFTAAPWAKQATKNSLDRHLKKKMRSLGTMEQDLARKMKYYLCSHTDDPGDDHAKWRKSDREQQNNYDNSEAKSKPPYNCTHSWNRLQKETYGSQGGKIGVKKDKGMAGGT